MLIAFLVRAFAYKRRAAVLGAASFLSLSLSLTPTLQPAACISEYTVGCLLCSRDKRPAVVYRHLCGIKIGAEKRVTAAAAFPIGNHNESPSMSQPLS